uniref:RNA-binding protein Musashi homolog 2-like n=1 Tax=Sinocyclocheilus anshuiensis TaxID=1608454 RepID=A0A671KWV2_9TELE
MEADASQVNSGSPNDSQHDPGKMFIGGLSWQTSPDSLRDYFSKFGEIRECMVMRDPTTKRSRGFGFITFADVSSVDKVLAQPHHELDSKTIDPKVAFPRRAQPKMVTRTKKIFVGGLSASTVVEDVKQYFEQFGKVEDAMLMFDKTTNRHRETAAESLWHFQSEMRMIVLEIELQSSISPAAPVHCGNVHWLSCVHMDQGCYSDIEGVLWQDFMLLITEVMV